MARWNLDNSEPSKPSCANPATSGPSGTKKCFSDSFLPRNKESLGTSFIISIAFANRRGGLQALPKSKYLREASKIDFEVVEIDLEHAENHFEYAENDLEQARNE